MASGSVRAGEDFRVSQSPVPFAPKPGQIRGPRLTGRFADGTLGEFPLGPATSLGRHPSNTLRLVDREVSKEHAVIERVGKDFILKDLGSSNGTFVNGKRANVSYLASGDRVRFGPVECVFRTDANSGAITATQRIAEAGVGEETKGKSLVVATVAFLATIAVLVVVYKFLLSK